MAPTPRPSCRGYALLELLIAMGLSALIVGGMGLILQVQERTHRRQGAGIDHLRTFDAAVQQLQQDLRMAGAGLPPRTLPAIVPGNGDGRPLITLRYLPDTPFVTTLTADASHESKLFRIPPKAAHQFRPGDQVLVHHDGTWLTFHVGAVRLRTRPGLKPHPKSLRQPPETSAPLAFPRGSEVLRLRDAEVQYWLARGQSGDHLLLRRRGGRETLIAAGVQDLRVEYLVIPPDEDNATGPHWTAQLPGDTSILGTRVRLALGPTSVRFTVTPRNLLPPPPS